MTIAVVSTSLGEQSRSRIAGEYVAKVLGDMDDVSVEWIDLSENPALPYPLSSSDEILKENVKKVQDADGLVIAHPIHNWGESGHTRDFLAYALDKKVMRHRICLLIAGCSTKSSYLAACSLSKTLQGEIQGVVIGPGILACGDDVNKETGEIVEGLQKRLKEGAEVLARLVTGSKR